MSTEKERKEHPQQTELRRIRTLLKILGDNLEYEDRNGIEAMRLDPIELKGRLRIKNSFELEHLLNGAIQLVDNKLSTLTEKKDQE